MVAASLVPLTDRATVTVPGILVVCPVISVGLTALTGALLRTAPAGILAGVVAAYAVAVAATQYAQGGGIEWGARYLADRAADGPAVAVASVHRAIEHLYVERGGVTKVVVTGSVVLASVAMAVLAARVLRGGHEVIRQFATRLEQAAALAPGPDLGDGDRRPIVVTTEFAVGRLTSESVRDVRGLTRSPVTTWPA